METLSRWPRCRIMIFSSRRSVEVNRVIGRCGETVETTAASWYIWRLLLFRGERTDLDNLLEIEGQRSCVDVAVLPVEEVRVEDPLSAADYLQRNCFQNIFIISTSIVSDPINFGGLSLTRITEKDSQRGIRRSLR